MTLLTIAPLIKQLVFYARRLTAGVNIQNEINKKYKELSK